MQVANKNAVHWAHIKGRDLLGNRRILLEWTLRKRLKENGMH
jgi:hypothetical protein